MLRFFSFIRKDDNFSDESKVAGTESLDSIRNKIVDSIYLIGAIIGTIALYGIIMRTIYVGWRGDYIFQIFLFIVNWTVLIFRKKIHLNWKAIIFFTVIFIANVILNYTEGIISGAMQFIIVTSLVALLFGWRLGVLTIFLSTVARIIIGWMYYNGNLVSNTDLNLYAISTNALITSIVGWLFASALIVFAINKFHRWLLLSLHSLSVKAKELSDANAELLIAKQKAEENDRLKSVFLANMSHEIRTPMNAIIGFSDLLAKKNVTEEKKLRYIKLIQERSFDLLGIIQDILDISKIEVGQMNLTESEVNINNLIAEIYEYYNLRVKHSDSIIGIDIISFVAEDIRNLSILVDSQRLKQVLNNLIDNAIKFTMNGYIEFGCERHSYNELMFYVRDTGIGISEDKYDLIFERFGQADTSFGARQYGGTGLGLSIVKGILQLMGGEIWFTSQVNEGTTFYFTVPIKPVAQEQKKVKNKKSVDIFNWKNKTILIVEDDLANSEYLSELLKGYDLNVLTAFSGKETLVLFEGNSKIDVILMDIRLTDINGVELSKNIKTKHPEIAIIAQTAYASNSDKEKCIKAGLDNYIAKPINTNQLLEILGEYLNK